MVYYANHLSDDKTHDSVFTTTVIHDLLEKFPDFVDYPVLRIKSDNCSSQYCCLYVFKSYSSLSKEIVEMVQWLRSLSKIYEISSCNMSIRVRIPLRAIDSLSAYPYPTAPFCL